MVNQSWHINQSCPCCWCNVCFFLAWRCWIRWSRPPSLKVTPCLWPSVPCWIWWEESRLWSRESSPRNRKLLWGRRRSLLVLHRQTAALRNPVSSCLFVCAQGHYHLRGLWISQAEVYLENISLIMRLCSALTSGWETIYCKNFA